MIFGSKNGPTRVDPSKMEDLANLKVTDGRVGDTLSIVGVGDEFSDLDFTVDRRAMVEFGEKRWTELSGLYRNRRITLEVHKDDEGLVLGWFDARQITLDELGLAEGDLGEIDKRQNPADFFEFEDKTWKYRWSREIGIFGESEVQGAGCYAWRFQEENGTRVLTVRKFADQPFMAYLAQQVNAGDVTVYRG